MKTDDPKIDALEHDNSGSDESFTANDSHKDHERDMLGVHKEELGEDFVGEKGGIDPGEEEGIEKAGYAISDTPSEIPAEEGTEEGFGLDDKEPDGTAEYDSPDEWN